MSTQTPPKKKPLVNLPFPIKQAEQNAAEEVLEDPIGQGCPGHDGSKAEHHPSMIAAHHGGIAGEDDSLPWKLRHISTSDSLLADNVIGSASPISFYRIANP